MSERRRIAVIMAGGSGERFWPLSRANHPKQLLKLADPHKSMLDQTVERAEPIVGRANIVIATAPHLVEPIREAMPALDDDQIQSEPHKRNTAGCLVWTVARVLAKDPEAEHTTSMAVLTADHRVFPEESCRRAIEAALDLAEDTGGLVTIGIRPDRPETGYGYIEIADGETHERREVNIFPVHAFREKPSLEKAQEYLDGGRSFWNSGTFFWRIDAFLAELKKASPALEVATREIAGLLRDGKGEEAEQAFAGIENISIDYALMEKAEKVFVAEAPFAWDDVGSWDALDRTMPQDSDGNVVMGQNILLDVKNSIVVNESGQLATCVLGVENLVVVVTEDAVLICPKDRSQDVKLIVNELKSRGLGRT